MCFGFKIIHSVLYINRLLIITDIRVENTYVFISFLVKYKLIIGLCPKIKIGIYMLKTSTDSIK